MPQKDPLSPDCLSLPQGREVREGGAARLHPIRSAFLRISFPAQAISHNKVSIHREAEPFLKRSIAGVTRLRPACGKL